MTVRQQTQRLPYPWLPRDLRPYAIATLLAIIAVAALVATFTAGLLAVVVIRQRIAPAPIAAPVAVAPAPEKVATAVVPVAAPSPLRVEWTTGRFDGEHPRLSGWIEFLKIEPDGTIVAIEYQATWVSRDHGQSWQRRPQTKAEQEEEASTTQRTNSSRIGSTVKPDSKTGAWPRWTAIASNGPYAIKGISEWRLIYPPPVKNMEGADGKLHASLFVSKDGGETWNEVVLPPEVLASGDIGAVAIEPCTKGTRVYVTVGLKIWQAEIKNLP